MNQDRETRNYGLLWATYLLLFPGACLFHVPAFGAFLMLALVLAYVLRSKARRMGHSLDEAHASWQINTVWLMVLLWVLLIGILLGYAIMVGSNDAIMAKLDELSSSDLPPAEMLRQFWEMPGSKMLFSLLALCGVLINVWPLKRILHGLLALKSHILPLKLGALRWAALVAAILIQAALSWLSFS